MPPLYVTTQGGKLRYRGRRLVVEKDGEQIAAIPAVHVSQVLIFGNVSMTTPAIAFLLEQGIDVAFLTMRGRYRGRLVGPTGGNSRLRLRQYRRVTEPAWALEVARAVVQTKLHNMRTLLRRYARRLADAIEQAPREELATAADQVGALIQSAETRRSINSLSGIEGRGTAVYFSVFRHLIREPGWSFETRNRRPPRDPVNVLLSFGYTLLTHQVESAIRSVGLDPYLGFLHQVAYNRPSLALDLVEPFRSIIVDSVTMRCINNRIVTSDHFHLDSKGPYPVRLDDEGRERFIRELEARLNLEFKHPSVGKRVSYRRCLELEVRQLARCLQTGEPFRPFRVR